MLFTITFANLNFKMVGGEILGKLLVLAVQRRERHVWRGIHPWVIWCIFFAQYDPALVDLFPLPTYVEQYLAITYNVFNKDFLMPLEQKGNSLLFKSWIQNVLYFPCFLKYFAIALKCITNQLLPLSSKNIS